MLYQRERVVIEKLLDGQGIHLAKMLDQALLWFRSQDMEKIEAAQIRKAAIEE